MKKKRTYTLAAETVATVRTLVEQRHLAPSQDAPVEMALADFFMTMRHAEEARRFAQASQDPEIVRELALLEHAFQTADREHWPA